MNIPLLKKLGNIDQICGIREATVLGGKGGGTRICELHNAAGLAFTVTPDRCCDIYDLTYKGVNLAFKTKNGLLGPNATSSANGEFVEQWSGGALVTCGLDNVGGHSDIDGLHYPTHGRIANTPASSFGAFAEWQGEDYILRCEGEIKSTRLYGKDLSIRRRIETGLCDKTIRIRDTITNFNCDDEQYMLLYHCNFGYPLLDEGAVVGSSRAKVTPMNADSRDGVNMCAPIDGKDEELYFYTELGDKACGLLYNPALELGVFVEFTTANLPAMLEWKMMKTHDYVLALEPCTGFPVGREAALRDGSIATLPAYSSIENELTIGIIDGEAEYKALIERIK